MDNGNPEVRTRKIDLASPRNYKHGGHHGKLQLDQAKPPTSTKATEDIEGYDDYITSGLSRSSTGDFLTKVSQLYAGDETSGGISSRPDPPAPLYNHNENLHPEHRCHHPQTQPT